MTGKRRTSNDPPAFISSSERMENAPAKALTAIRFSKSKQAWRYTTGGRGGFEPPFPSGLVIVSWNVDRSARFPHKRLMFLLEYVKIALAKCCAEGKEPPPSCILLQEVHREAFPAILADEWVREYFQVIPGTASEWPAKGPGEAMYGNVTIVARNVPVSNARMLGFRDSSMGRHASLIDVHLNVPAKPKREGKERDVELVVRIANVHLEGRAEGIISRTNQFAAVVEEIKDNTIDGGLMCGDMNAIRMEDQTLGMKHGMRDAWTRGDEDSAGYTLGYQAAKSSRAPRRVDKIMHWQYRERFFVEEPRMLGIGLKMRDGLAASDHYGLLSLMRYRP